jgi:hypothetical protein
LTIDNQRKFVHTAGVNIETAPAGISAEDWNATPLAVRQLVLTLLETVEHWQHRVAELEERLNQNSRNSQAAFLRPANDAIPSETNVFGAQGRRTTRTYRTHTLTQTA